MSGYWVRAASPFVLAALTYVRAPKPLHEPVEYGVWVDVEERRVGEILCACGQVGCSQWDDSTQTFLELLTDAWVNSGCAL